MLQPETLTRVANKENELTVHESFKHMSVD